MEEKFTLKAYYNQQFMADLAAALAGELPKMKKDPFLASIFDEEWEDRPLKARMRHIVQCMKLVLPNEYSKAITVLDKVAPKFTGLTALIFPDFIQQYGLEHYDVSIAAMERYTSYSTAEFAVRPFIKRYPKKMMAQMLAWADHKNEHVRRLASEGCRPRLPWGGVLKGFVRDPAPILPILEKLKADKALYVRKSIANNLNDVSKDHQKLVLDTAERWLKKGNKDTRWIVKQALRTLLKKGNKRALMLFGFGAADKAIVSSLEITKPVLQIGEHFRFNFFLEWKGKQEEKLRLEYAIDYVKANKSTSRKIFQIKEDYFQSGQKYTIDRKQHFQQLTTRKHYPGIHNLTILVNGEEKSQIKFELKW